ncbi:11897_t:CDS:2, partial [Gigaspora margarita]
MNDHSLEIVASDEIGNTNFAENEQNMELENDSTQLTLEIINEDINEDISENINEDINEVKENFTDNNSKLERISDDVNENDIRQKVVNVLVEEKDSKIIAVTEQKPTRPMRKKSYQLRALAGKTLSYQKRQKCVNIFWVTICPLLMVTIATLVGTITDIITPEPPVYLLCSNSNASRLDGRKYRIGDKNFIIPRTLSDQILSAPRNQTIINYNLDLMDNTVNECVFWFGRDYPYRAPYENDPQVSSDSLKKRDTTFVPEPLFGYFDPSTPASNYGNLLMKETFPWAYVRDAPSVFSGDRPLSLTNLIDPSQFSPRDSFNYGTGFLSMIDTLYYSQYQSINNTIQYIPLPYFQKWRSDSTEKQLDLEMNDKLDDVLNKIRSLSSNSQNFSDLKRNLINQIPWGIILFDNIGNKSQKQWSYTLQFGSNDTLYYNSFPQYIIRGINQQDQLINAISRNYLDNRFASFPQSGFRKVAQQNQLSNAILRTALDNDTSAFRPSITTGFRSMPHLYIDIFDINQLFSSLIGGILYPFGISFLLPTFVIILVKEKEDRIVRMMKMHGLSSIVYYFTHYLHFYILYIITSALLIVTGYFLKLTFFTLTDPWLIVILFFIWGHIQIAMAFLLSTFFKRSRNALVMTFVIVLCSVIFAFGIELVNTPFNGNGSPLFYFVWPPFAFYRAMSIINHSSFLVDLLPMKLSDLRPGNEVF